MLGKFHTDESGQGIVELAALLPLLVALLVVGGDVARSYYFAVVVTDASEQGARQATKTPQDDTKIRNAALQAAPFGVLASGNVTISGSRQAGGAVTVGVSYTFKPITPFAAAIIGSSVPVSRSATMRVR